ncbi:hypothetical protein RHMOL_Rhmol10G0200900 [Rhododendron molle]|uniref:Uncharacterized protein n=1 Tax=Rhododendron molle TaxID=49168 RepID=A0ACC0M4F7_RHOML|nr:hypothetical protein RHMOL_Rhmol10G0200900 [Rhododendron molle]
MELTVARQRQSLARQKRLRPWGPSGGGHVKEGDHRDAVKEGDHRDSHGDSRYISGRRRAIPASSDTSHIVEPCTEHLPDEKLAKLLEDNPMIGEMVLKAKEERARAIVVAEAAERAEREHKVGDELLGEAEAEERAGIEVQ